MERAQHIAIAGGGIIGLACALALRRRGLQVTVLEAGEAAKEASWAAGGMLAAEDPENPPALLLLSRYSRGLYSDFLEAIETFSGHHVPLRTNQTIQILDRGHKAQASALLSGEEARKLVPGLIVKGAHEHLLLEEASLDPRELCAALRAAILKAGVVLREHERVVSVERYSDGILVSTVRGTLRADKFVNCCGAWATSLDPAAGVVPSKGQMLVIAQPKDTPLTRVLRSPEVYLIPRGDHRIVVGATVEDAGYSKQVEHDALAELRRRAAALWEPAAHAPQIDSWAGLRPATADALPVIGRYEDAHGMQFVATGHFRNGILLAPGTAQVVANLICGVSPAVDLASFVPHRPSISAGCDKHFAAAL